MAIPPTNIGKEGNWVLIFLIRLLVVCRLSVSVIEIKMASAKIFFNELITESEGNEGDAL
jgi:hypothetical protein